MKPFHVKLNKRIVVKERKGRTFNWPAYTGWDAVLIKKTEVERIRKRWNIPYTFPEDTGTFIYEDEIIKKL